MYMMLKNYKFHPFYHKLSEVLKLWIELNIGNKAGCIGNTNHLVKIGEHLLKDKTKNLKIWTQFLNLLEKLEVTCWEHICLTSRVNWKNLNSTQQQDIFQPHITLLQEDKQCFLSINQRHTKMGIWLQLIQILKLLSLKGTIMWLSNT